MNKDFFFKSLGDSSPLCLQYNQKYKILSLNTNSFIEI